MHKDTEPTRARRRFFDSLRSLRMTEEGRSRRTTVGIEAGGFMVTQAALAGFAEAALRIGIKSTNPPRIIPAPAKSAEAALAGNAAELLERADRALKPLGIGESPAERLALTERLTRAIAADIGSKEETEREIFHYILKREGFDLSKAVREYLLFHYA